MIGVLLAGGMGTRMLPVTSFVNKTLLPLGKYPMIYWPLMTMVKSGLKKILIVTGGPFASQVLQVVNTFNLGVEISFVMQKQPLGMADAIGCAAKSAQDRAVFVCGGDNVFGGSYKKIISGFKSGEISMLREVEEPKRYAVPVYKGSRLVKIVEKPNKTIGNWAITGPHLFDNRVFGLIKKLKPSARGELEIADLHTQYLDWGSLKLLKRHDYWIDAGTLTSYAQAQADVINRRVRI